MSSNSILPHYQSAELERLHVDGLVALMLRDEDRVPRAVIDACAARGDETVAWLRRLVAREYWRVDLPLNEWWLKLHAAMILGLIGTDAAGLLLVDLMRRMSEEGDENLQDWFAGEWPALFQNKPESSASALRALSEDRSLDWYIRADALDAVIAVAARAGEGALARSLDWAAALAADDREDWDMRVSIGATLLDFPRTAHRPMLEDLAARQLRDGEWGVHFAPDEVREAFDTGRDAPGWDRRPKPWNFYALEHILQRQERWTAEAAAAARAERAAQSAAPYVRTNPRIGRNDPCPCGSGKKYKKCCMPATEV